VIFIKVSEFHKDYTSGDKFTFVHLLTEIKELLVELLSFNKEGILDEFSDVSAFLQLWMYSRFSLDRSLWKTSLGCYEKLRRRKQVWRKIYAYAGIRNGNNYGGNYEREHKVIAHLGKYGVPINKAKDAHKIIVLPLLNKH